MTRLSPRSRLLVAVAAALLLVLYAVPLWRIELSAPQYPEGLGMLIRVNTITGIRPPDLDNINGLNHYIGMKAIVPDAIPVLRYMPWVVGALAALGLAAAAIGRRAALAGWLVAFGLAGAAGLLEFYRWSYDYGHHLAPDAVIKVPGMSYQPPLVGTKQLLNFTASSWPDVGGWIAAAAFLLGVVAWAPWRPARAVERALAGGLRRAALGVGALALVVAAGCARERGPVPIQYDAADCDVCRMRISDRRHGGEVVTSTGRVHQFDSIECLADYVAKGMADGGAGASVYVSDFERPGTLLPVDSAIFVRRGGGSPMGAGLLAVARRPDTAAVRTALGGEILTWRAVRDLAAAGGLRPARPVAAAASPLLGAQERAEVVVSPGGAVRSVSAALRLVKSGGRVVVEAGTYREPEIVVSRPVELVGRGRPVLDGEGRHAILTVAADDVTVRGLRLARVGSSYVEDRAALRIRDARRCTVVDNEIADGFFGIYLANVTGCRIERNALRASGARETTSGNGIHLWSSRGITIAGNRVSGFRDGIYFEFVHDTELARNLSDGNLRYGLHFMYSDDCRYLDNTFRRNGSGVAVMYSHRVLMSGNRFERNWGSAAYGLLLKEIGDARLERNRFTDNTTGLVADGANRMVVDRNDFLRNGWAVRLDASTVDGEITRNNFVANGFDVATNSREPSTTVRGNYWDAYRGFDLDRDGVGDVPFRPVRLFSMIVERHDAALVLLRSGFVDLLDTAERALPVITPAVLADARPAMRRIP